MKYPTSKIPTTKEIEVFFKKNKLEANDFKGLVSALKTFHTYYKETLNIQRMDGCLKVLITNVEEAQKTLESNQNGSKEFNESITKQVLLFQKLYTQERDSIVKKYNNSDLELTKKKTELEKQIEQVDALIVQVNKWQIKWDLLKPPEKSQEKQGFLKALEQTNTFSVKYEQKAKELCLEVEKSVSEARDLKDAGLMDSEKLLQGWLDFQKPAEDRHKSQKTRSTWNLMTRIGKLKVEVEKTPSPK